VNPNEPGASSEPVTELLGAIARGDAGAWDRLLALVEADLRRIAHLQLRGRSRQETLQTTALVNEAYLRLARPATSSPRDRVHFLAVASRARRQILVDRARARAAAKRGGGAVAVDLDFHDPAAPERGEDLLALEAALVELERCEPRLGRVVEMRFYGGMTFEEVGTALDLSDRTIKTDWRKARAFLEGRLAAQGIGPTAAP
jgi:RNA polymerase sigma factor (TIGR02999 family)